MTIELKKLFEVGEGLNEKMVIFILNAIKEHHEEGMDYIKFKQSVQNLMQMNMDELTSVKSAYATASTMGMTKEKLIKSIYAYQAVVDKERDKFIETLKSQIQSQVEEPKAEINKIQNSIEEHKRKIVQLEKEMALMTENTTSMQNDIVISEEKIEKTRSQFLAVYESFKSNFEADKSQFEHLLQ